MSEFQQNFYHCINQKIENEFEPLFMEFQHQIYIFQKQFNLTLKSYRNEWDAEIALNRKKYEDNKKYADIIYNDEIHGFENDESAQI